MILNYNKNISDYRKKWSNKENKKRRIEKIKLREL